MNFIEIIVKRGTWAVVSLIFLVTACSAPVGVRPVGTEEAHRLLTANALSTGTPSMYSLQLLSRLGLLERFEDAPEAALAEIHSGLSPTDDDRFFALAELSFLHAGQRKGRRAAQQQLCRAQKGKVCPSSPSHGEQEKDHAYYLAAAAYAYAFLFPENPVTTLHDPADPRLRLAYDLYNRGLTEGLTEIDEEEVALASSRRKLPFGTLEIEFVSAQFTWAGYPLENFVPTDNLAVYGLRNRYRHAGIGAPLAASLAGTTDESGPIASRIPKRLKVPVTAFLRLESPRQALMVGTLHGRLELYSSDLTETVTVNGQTHPLEFEPTAALAYTLESSNVFDFEIAGFLGGALSSFIPKDRAQDGLFLLHPPSLDLIPIVLVHGTASSPGRWADLINELESDPRIRDHYQIWLFIYDTGNPVGYSGGRLRQALENVVHELDPEGKSPALQRMVVIGHSQGGLLTKLTAIDAGSRFWDNISKVPLDQLDVDPETRELLRRSLFFEPLPFVKRVIFISTPHRGSYMAALRLGQIASWLVNMPSNLTQRTLSVVTRNQDQLLVQKLAKLPTSIDNMDPSSPFIKTLAAIPVANGITAHSIIAVQGDGPIESGSDGVVKYESAHIEEVESEFVVRSGHSTQGNPKTIEEIRRILLEHLGTEGKH